MYVKWSVRRFLQIKCINLSKCSIPYFQVLSTFMNFLIIWRAVMTEIIDIMSDFCRQKPSQFLASNKLHNMTAYKITISCKLYYSLRLSRISRQLNNRLNIYWNLFISLMYVSKLYYWFNHKNQKVISSFSLILEVKPNVHNNASEDI